MRAGVYLGSIWIWSHTYIFSRPSQSRPRSVLSHFFAQIRRNACNKRVSKKPRSKSPHFAKKQPKDLARIQAPGGPAVKLQVGTQGGGGTLCSRGQRAPAGREDLCSWSGDRLLLGGRPLPPTKSSTHHHLAPTSLWGVATPSPPHPAQAHVPLGPGASAPGRGTLCYWAGPLAPGLGPLAPHQVLELPLTGMPPCPRPTPWALTLGKRGHAVCVPSVGKRRLPGAEPHSPTMVVLTLVALAPWPLGGWEESGPCPPGPRSGPPLPGLRPTKLNLKFQIMKTLLNPVRVYVWGEVPPSPRPTPQGGGPWP